MSNTIYTPAAGALDGRVCAYFLKHRDEQLSPNDIALKFDAPVSLVEAALANAITTRLLERVRGGPGGRVWQYRAGQRIVALLITAGAPATSKPPPFPPAAKRPRKPPVVVDAASIKIERDVALPEARFSKPRTNWPVLFERLAEPNLCSSPLPREVRGTLNKAAGEWFGKRGWKFTIRAISDTHIRIWRTA
jgi:hypothetical protein